MKIEHVETDTSRRPLSVSTFDTRRESWVPNGARCEAIRLFPDDNMAECGEPANRRVRDPEGRERCVCNGHGHDLPTIYEPCATCGGDGMPCSTCGKGSSDGTDDVDHE